MECGEKRGMHIWRIISAPNHQPDTGERSCGRKGELVFTTITKEGIPMIATARTIYVLWTRLSCGRTHIPMKKVLGAPTTCTSSAGQRVPVADLRPRWWATRRAAHYLLVVTRKPTKDTLEVGSSQREVFSDAVRMVEDLSKRITRSFAGAGHLA
jgi:phenylacetate-CoA ligase